MLEEEEGVLRGVYWKEKEEGCVLERERGMGEVNNLCVVS